MAGGRELDGALDELYGVAPSEFVASRKALAAELRAGGDAEAAKQLAAARRPTTAAWAVNRLAREHPDLVEELIERSVELRAIQSRGQGDDLRAASAERRAALNGATDAAVVLAGAVATNPDAHRDAIAATLEAASVDETIGAALRAGRLVREAVGAVGFPEIAPLALVEQPTRSSRRAAPKAAKGDTKDEREQAAAAEAEAAVERVEDEARTARQHASELAVAAGEAEQRLEEQQAALEDAQAALRDAKTDVRRAHAELKEAQRAQTIADRAVEKARQRLG